MTLWLAAETGLPVHRAHRVVYEGRTRSPDGPCVTEEAYADGSFDALPDTLSTLPD